MCVVWLVWHMYGVVVVCFVVLLCGVCLSGILDLDVRVLFGSGTTVGAMYDELCDGIWVNSSASRVLLSWGPKAKRLYSGRWGCWNRKLGERGGAVME